ncbi:hypothetical protein FF38_13593 [Lucilia cuprina]|uniref:Uncharacterized protein n=1 Tax=Lucilia cuprina TaxID=7375 RepID=A0A0L0BR26_LUCCU|nr:hypothetical protein FF38_13593 [Lucilia cuprina]
MCLLLDRTKKNPCNNCIEFKEMIIKQNQIITDINGEHKQQWLTKNKIIVEMLAEQKIQLQGLHNVRKNINNLITVYPIKTEEDLQKMETQINEANEDKYIHLTSAAINSYSTNAEKEIMTALQVVKKRHFRSVCAKKKVSAKTDVVLETNEL